MPHHVAIIGAGPLGIELAVALKRAGIEYLHLDAGQIGQTISGFPPQTRFFSSNERIAIAGVPLQTPDQSKATREQYLAYLRGVVEQFDLKVNAYEPVVDIRRRSEGGFELLTRAHGAQRRYAVQKIVLATGGTARPRRLNIPGEDLPHVHWHWKDPHDYFRQRVLVIGGRNSAVETALRLHLAGARVSLSYRRAELPSKSIKYWLMPEISGYIRSGAIRAHFGTIVTRITSSHATLQPCPDVAGSLPGTVPIDVEADFVIPQIGYVADMSLARLAGVELAGEREVPIYDPQTMETNVPGVYICGTAVAGTQAKYEVFIENGHVHVERIVAHITGAGRRVAEPAPYLNPES